MKLEIRRWIIVSVVGSLAGANTANAGAPPPPPPPCAKAYVDANFSGTERTICGNGPVIDNDAYSSYRVPYGTNLRTFEHGDGVGLARTYFENAPKVGAWYNDNASTVHFGTFYTNDAIAQIGSYFGESRTGGTIINGDLA